MSRRVVITGMGGITPIGNDIEEIRKNLKAGYNGIGPISYYDTSEREVKLAGEVKGFDAEEFMTRKDARRMDQVSRFGIAAARKALEDSGLDLEEIQNNDRVSVYISSGIGGMKTIQDETEKGIKRGYDRISPFFVPMVIANMTAAHVSIDLGINGASNCPVSACAGGINAIGDAFRSIKDGYSDISFAGGSEAAISELGIGGFTSMRALTTAEDPDRGSIPFDEDRAGFVMGEGAGVLILEEYEKALARGAKIYAEVVGYGFTSDASHITAPNENGTWAGKAMSNALEEAGLKPEDVNYINAHGTSTPLNDAVEAKAIHNALGEEYGRKVPVSSTKSMTGHLLGAAGAIETMFCALAIQDGFIPPNINLKNPDKSIELNVISDKRDMDVNVAMSNSLGFGGHNGSVIIRKLEK